MHFGPTVFVLLCSFLCPCNGSSGGQTNKNISFRSKAYTDTEDKMIINEVNNLIDEYKSINNAKLWDEIAVKHHKEYQDRTYGFRHERSAGNLRHRFLDILLRKQAQDEDIPKTLVEKLNLLRLKKIDGGYRRVRERTYTSEEVNLIVDELLKPSCKSMCGVATLKILHARFHEKHREEAKGFEVERSISGIRSFMYNRRKKRQFPKPVLKKFLSSDKGESSSSSSLPGSQQTENELPADDDEEWIAGAIQDLLDDEDDHAEEMVEELLNNTDKDSKVTSGVRYTDEEDKFILEEVLRLVDDYKSEKSRVMWTKIADNHRDKWLRGRRGFPQERSDFSLRMRFKNVLPKTLSQKEGKDLQNKLTQLQQLKKDRGSDRLRQRSYTAEEEKVIFDELLNPSCASVFGATTYQSILAKFREKRLQNAPGFKNERTFNALRTHLKLLKKKKQFPKEVVNKFWLLEKGASSSGSSSQSQQTDSQLNNEGQDEIEEQEEDDWIEEMLEVLQNSTNAIPISPRSRGKSNSYL